jgi:O-antigen/teichoic acid export membrane protein
MIFHGAKRTGVVGVVTAAAAILNIVLNFVLIPVLGVPGAAVATFVAYLGTCAAFMALSRDVLRFDPDFRHMAACMAAAGAMGGVLAAWSPRGGVALAGALVAAAALYFAVLWLLRALLPSIFGHQSLGLAALLRRSAR